MRVEIDQSGKVEDTGRKTVVAYADSNNKTKSVLISARTKRKIQEIYRTIGKSKLFVYNTFSILLYFLTKDCSKSDLIAIDLEYPGRDKIILDMLLNIREIYKMSVLNIRFVRIGSKPKSHFAAKNVFNNKKKADIVLVLKDIVEIIKKTDGRLKKSISIPIGARPRSSCIYYSKKVRKIK